MTTSNWTKFDKAFNQVSAFVVLDIGTKNVVAKISLKYPKDGAGRLSCYMHIIGTEVQIGTASGYGYDKCTASIISAAKACYTLVLSKGDCDTPCHGDELKFLKLLLSDKAQGCWQEVINEKNGFTVIQVI